MNNKILRFAQNDHLAMNALTLSDLYQSLANQTIPDADSIAIRDVVIDSRRVSQGSVFVALKGESRDGHDFIADALSRGAVAIIAEERAKSLGLGPNVHYAGAAGLQLKPQTLVPTIFIVPSSLKGLQQLAKDWRQKFSSRVVAVTGSLGKSSTKELIASVLRQRFKTLKSEGNLNNEIGLPLALLQLNETHERIVLEMGMYALGEIRELCEIAQPHTGVVTNVGPTHLERLGTIEKIAQAKGELIEALPDNGSAILNGDDPRVRAMGAKTRAKKFLYGLNSNNDLWADEIESFGLEGVAFVAHSGSEQLHLRVPLLGRHSVHTALAAASVGLAEGMSWDEINRGLKDTAAQLRLVAIRGEMGTMILDDTYNSSPTSALAALNLLNELRGRKIAVLGDMLELGTYEKQGHDLVGGRAAQVVDALITVGSLGRLIGDAAREAGLPLDQVHYADSNAQAIETLRGVMQTGDVILIKGSRGAKMDEMVVALAQSKAVEQ